MRLDAKLILGNVYREDHCIRFCACEFLGQEKESSKLYSSVSFTPQGA